MTEGEQVLGFSAELMNELGHFEGFAEGHTAFRYRDFILTGDKLSYMDRKAAEQDPSFKQLIPYCVLAVWGKAFVYQRTKKAGEERLRGNYSLGVGGHINPVDNAADNHETYKNAMERELLEEVGNLPAYRNTIAGVLYDSSNEVGKVHFGVVHVLSMDEEPEIKSTDESLTEGKFQDILWIKENKDKFENWSKLIIDGMLK